MDRQKIYDMFKIFNSHSDDYLGAMFINIFKTELPFCYRYFYNNDGILEYKASQLALDRYKFNRRIDTRQFLQNLIKIKNEYENKIKNISVEDFSINEIEKIDFDVFNYSSNEFLICGEYPAPFMFNLTTSIDADASDTYNDLYVAQGHIDEVFEKIIRPNCVALDNKNKLEFGIASIMEGTNTLYTSWFDYDVNIDIDIKKNYNDDLPYDKMCEILDNDKRPDLMLFYGEPGTGKTSLIKHLIKKYINKNFIFIDGGLLGSIPQEKLMSYFLDNWDTVFILEDCEKILKDRSSGYNPVMPVLLNITDGIIGDVLKTKFICTFNDSLSKVDRALLRKGRLSLKYEFKKLDKIKVSELLGRTVNEDMSLADIYYDKEENDYSKKITKKIGF